MTMKVGFVGLGLMGQPMAKNVAKKGFALCVFNRTPEKALPLKEAGASLAASPKEAAKGAEVVVLMLTGPEAVDQVLDGPQGVLAGLESGKTIVNMSTVPPSYSRRLFERLKSRSIVVLDAPVYGSKKPAEEGALVIPCRRASSKGEGDGTVASEHGEKSCLLRGSRAGVEHEDGCQPSAGHHGDRAGRGGQSRAKMRAFHGDRSGNDALGTYPVPPL